MKTVAIILALATTIIAIPASDSTKLVAREPDCQSCMDKYDFCVSVSNTPVIIVQNVVTNIIAERPHRGSERLHEDLCRARLLVHA